MDDLSNMKSFSNPTRKSTSEIVLASLLDKIRIEFSVRNDGGSTRQCDEASHGDINRLEQSVGPENQ